MEALEKRIAALSPQKLAILEKKLKSRRLQAGLETVGLENNAIGDQTGGVDDSKLSLSFSQERLWFIEQLEPGTRIHHLPALFPLPANADKRIVAQCLDQLQARHGALRTTIFMEQGRAYQRVHPLGQTIIDFQVHDQAVDASEPLSTFINRETWKPFDLLQGPLWRARLILAQGQAFLLLVMHHIISDGWSLNLFYAELKHLYEAAVKGEAARLGQAYQYADYTRDQFKRLQGDRLENLLNYWRHKLDSIPAVIDLPTDYARPAKQTYRGAIYSFNLAPEIMRQVKSLCAECDLVPFMLLLAAFKTLLFRYSAQTDIVVGTPVANRGQLQWESVIGFLVNTLVLRSSLSGDMRFRDLLAQVRTTTLNAYKHQELPFEKLVAELQPERSLSYNPLFQVMFTFQNLPGSGNASGSQDEGAHACDTPRGEPKSAQLDVTQSKFDLTLAMTEADDGLSAVFEYNTDLFNSTTMERMAAHFTKIVKDLTARPDTRLADFPLLSGAEKKQLLQRWNATERVWDNNLALHQYFEASAQRIPDATALIFEDRSLTYRQLNQAANGVAKQLLQNPSSLSTLGVVGIYLTRSVEMVVGLLGILKAGGAYLPLEPDYPSSRIGYMLEDAQVNCVLTLERFVETLPETFREGINCQVIALDRLLANLDKDGQSDCANPEFHSHAKNLAYVLYTSGSTGQPKGVMVSHCAIGNRLAWMQSAYALEETDKVLQKTPYSFDVSVWEFFWPLSQGACLVLAKPEGHKDSRYLVELIQREGITDLHFVPSMLQLFLQENISECKSLKRIYCSGEALTISQCKALNALPDIQAYNLYGPTEAAIDVTHWPCALWRDQYASVPIGKPIANTQIYILNEKGYCQPIGVTGEIHIGGVGLAEGYLNKPELTASTFVAGAAPELGQVRLYKTGDYGRFHNDGTIEYLGRLDSQVKLRGLRIELGEIESELCKLPIIDQAVVVVSHLGENDERLVAYLVLAESAQSGSQSFDEQQVKTYLSGNLPKHMVPTIFVVLPELPLTTNGKLNRKSLPKPFAQAGNIAKEQEQGDKPVVFSEVEKQISLIWCEILKKEKVNPGDDFFDLGGHSLLVTQVVNAINQIYHLNLPMRVLFENPTLKKLAEAVQECREKQPSAGSIPREIKSPHKLLAQIDSLSESEIEVFLISEAQHPLLERLIDAILQPDSSRSFPSRANKASVNGFTSETRNSQALSLGKPLEPHISSVAENAALIDQITSLYYRFGREFEQLQHQVQALYCIPRPVLQSSVRASLKKHLAKESANLLADYLREVKPLLCGERSFLSPPELALFSWQLQQLSQASLHIEFQLQTP